MVELNLFKIWFARMFEALRYNKASARVQPPDSPDERLKEEFSVASDGLRIRGRVFFPKAKPDKLYPAALICHGIPGSGNPRPSDDPGYEGLAEQFTSLGMVAVIFNFRGCGDSEGDFDMAGWVRDLEAVLDRTLNTPHIDPSRVALIGFSGGGAAAIRAAADNSRVYAMAVVGTPADFELFDKEPSEVIEDFKERGIIRNPSFAPDIARWIEGFRDIEPKHWIAHFKGKSILIVHGDADVLVPVEHATQLFNRAPAGTAELFIIPGGVHRLRLDPRCIARLTGWAVDKMV